MKTNTLVDLITAVDEHRTVTEAVRILTRRYFENYTDATKLDDQFVRALEMTMIDDVVIFDDADLADAVRAGERDIMELTGRRVETFPDEED